MGDAAAADYSDRPAQADQLHFDLWWRGENIVCDAGTYLYNGLEPWRNGLRGRNQSAIDSEPMGRQSKLGTTDTGSTALCTSVLFCGHSLDCWIVVEDVVGASSASVRLHWLFPDYEFVWEEDEHRLRLQTPSGPFQCWLRGPAESAMSLIRGGELLAGASSGSDGDSQIRGWRSLYHGEKIPALSLAAARELQVALSQCTHLLRS